MADNDRVSCDVAHPQYGVFHPEGHPRNVDSDTTARLEAMEAKLDRVLEFTGKLEALLAAYLGSGAKGVLAAVLKSKGVGR